MMKRRELEGVDLWRGQNLQQELGCLVETSKGQFWWGILGIGTSGRHIGSSGGGPDSEDRWWLSYRHSQSSPFDTITSIVIHTGLRSPLSALVPAPKLRCPLASIPTIWKYVHLVNWAQG